ncbi:TPA: hypothetical protein ACX6RO_001871 [Photobacterium damselae]
MQLTKIAKVILLSQIFSFATLTHAKEFQGNGIDRSYQAAPTYNDSVIEKRMKTNVPGQHLPQTIMLSGTAFPDRNVDSVTAGIDLKPFTIDELNYDIYVPIGEMASYPRVVTVSLKTNMKLTRAYDMSFASTTWFDGYHSWSDSQAYNNYGYRYEGVYISAKMTNSKPHTFNRMDSNSPNLELADDSNLPLQDPKPYRIRSNNNSRKSEDADFESALVTIMPQIHPFMPALLSGVSSGDYASTKEPFFSIGNNPSFVQNTPIMFTGKLSLKFSSGGYDGGSRYLGFKDEKYKYLHIRFHLGGAMRFSRSMYADDEPNKEMDRRIATQCRNISLAKQRKIQYPPAGLQNDPKNADELTSSLSRAGLGRWDLSECDSKRVEVYPLAYTLIVS